MLVLILSSVLLGAILLRWLDYRADAVKRRQLIARQPVDPVRFDVAMIADLPAPARRYFRFSISPGTPLYPVADISMSGSFSLGDKHSPAYMSMTAEQTLAAPEGFVWRMSAASKMMRISGSDSDSWTRFWIYGVVPVARSGGDADHRLSAFGRFVAEALFWTPAALLPGAGITWRAVSESVSRVRIRHGDLEQDVELVVDPEGRPTVVRFLRWSNANADKTYRYQPFGGFLSGFKEFEGITVPTHVEAGNDFGTDDYFPFFIADVSRLHYPRPVGEDLGPKSGA